MLDDTVVNLYKIPVRIVCKIEWKDLELKQRVGVGNFAMVYKALHLREDCAVKSFTNQGMSSKEFAAFVNETTFLHRLRHPHGVIRFPATMSWAYLFR